MKIRRKATLSKILLSSLITFFMFFSIGFASWEFYSEYVINEVINIPTFTCFNNKTHKKYYRIEDALKVAKYGEEVVCIPHTDPVIRKDCTVPNGVNLVMPVTFNETDLTYQWNYRKSGQGVSNEGDWNTIVNFADNNATNFNKYCVNNLTIKSGVTLNINGSLSIGGVVGPEYMIIQGSTSGLFNQITMEEDTTINLENSASQINCLGYIKESFNNNNSVINVNSGKIYEPFVIYDYRGGSSTAGTYQNGNISPFRDYDLPNIRPKMIFQQESTLVGYADLYTSKVSVSVITIEAKHNTTDVRIIASKDALVNLAPNSRIEYKYTPKDPKYTTIDYLTRNSTVLNCYGGFSTGSMSLVVKVVFGDVKVNTANLYFPLSYKQEFNFIEGNFNINNKFKALPGAKIKIFEKANVNLENDLIIYEKLEEQRYSEYQYRNDYPPASLTNNGTLNANSGYFGAFVNTEETKENYSTLNVKTTNLTATSSEGYGTRDGLTFGYVETYKETQTARANIKEANSAPAIANLAASAYMSLSGTDYYAGGDQIGSYTINFHLNGGSNENYAAENDVISRTLPILKGENIPLNNIPISNPSKRGYTFVNWFTDNNTFNNPYTNLVVSSGNTYDLYAKYNEEEYQITYNVSYDEGLSVGDVTNKNPIKYTISDLPIKLSDLEDSYGYNFYGFYDESGNKIHEINESNGIKDLTLSARFSRRNLYSVRIIDKNNKLSGIPQLVGRISEFNFPTDQINEINNDIEYPYYIDDQYYLDENYSNPLNSDFTLTQDTDIYVKNLEKFKVDYFGNDESVPGETTYHKPNTNISISPYELLNYKYPDIFPPSDVIQVVEKKFKRAIEAVEYELSNNLGTMPLEGGELTITSNLSVNVKYIITPYHWWFKFLHDYEDNNTGSLNPASNISITINYFDENEVSQKIATDVKGTNNEFWIPAAKEIKVTFEGYYSIGQDQPFCDVMINGTLYKTYAGQKNKETSFTVSIEELTGPVEIILRG